jgi:mRNA interferase MazF
MAGFVKGDVVVIPFPFSDLTGSKRRPAFVLGCPDGRDVILCQITSKATDKMAVEVDTDAYSSGGLSLCSRIRPNRIFTADVSLILYAAGHVAAPIITQVDMRLKEILALP